MALKFNFNGCKETKQIWAQWTKISVTVGWKWIYTDVFYAWILSITLNKSLCSQSANVNVTTFKLFWNYISKQTYTNVSSFLDNARIAVNPIFVCIIISILWLVISWTYMTATVLATNAAMRARSSKVLLMAKSLILRYR